MPNLDPALANWLIVVLLGVLAVFLRGLPQLVRQNREDIVILKEQTKTHAEKMKELADVMYALKRELDTTRVHCAINHGNPKLEGSGP